MNQPDLVITHGPSCADGFACAWIIEGKWPGTPVHIGVYGEPPPDVTGLGVLITDFSYPEEVLREMAEKAKWIHVLDHHDTARDPLNKVAREGVIKINFDNNRSGAALTWDYCWGAGRAMPWIVQYVQDRDLWRFELEGTREAHALIMSHPLDLRVWSDLARRFEDLARRKAAIAEGGAILRDRMRLIGDMIDATARIEAIGGHEVPVANIPYAFASEAGNLLCEGHPFAATYVDLKNGLRQFSLRSSREGGLHVGEIAKTYGGGGHEHAAGFTVELVRTEETEET